MPVKLDVSELVDEYVGEKSWRVKENANVAKTFTGLFNYIAVESLARYALEVFKPYIDAHVDGWIHMHDLAYSPWIAYCVGWSAEKILREGIIAIDVAARPAKHLDSAADHIANFLMSAQHEWSGAQALSKVDLYLAAFAAHDRASYREVKQNVQRLIYNLNFPSRAGAQTPFTNFTLLLDTVPEALEDPAVVGGKDAGKLGDYLGEAHEVFRAFAETLLEGDGSGRPFTFPIPTLMVTENFDWNGKRWGELTDLIFEVSARRGSFYFLNALSGNVDPKAAYAMCCRLTIDVSKLAQLELPRELKLRPFPRKQRKGGVWAIPDETGSIGVVTLNLPRLGYEARGDWDKLESMLLNLLGTARKLLQMKRERLEKILREKPFRLPITERYLGTYRFHYNTVGVIGLPEFAANMMREPRLWFEPEKRKLREAVSVMKKALTMISKVIDEYEEEDQVPYNLEEVPGEGACYRLARLDLDRYRRAVESGDYCMPMHNGTPFYSNSIVPYYAEVPLWTRVELEAEVHPFFTGGVMMHVFLGQQPDPEALKKLVYRICHTKVTYFSITPAITYCQNCNTTTVGVYSQCPRCGSPLVEVWSRIVGYYRPLYRWNPGKKAEFALRVHYNV